MRYVLLTYNAPATLEIWAAMTESERRAEEDEYVQLVEAMRKSKRLCRSKRAGAVHSRTDCPRAERHTVSHERPCCPERRIPHGLLLDRRGLG